MFMNLKIRYDSVKQEKHNFGNVKGHAIMLSIAIHSRRVVTAFLSISFISKIAKKKSRKYQMQRFLCFFSLKKILQ